MSLSLELFGSGASAPSLGVDRCGSVAKGRLLLVGRESVVVDRLLGSVVMGRSLWVNCDGSVVVLAVIWLQVDRYGSVAVGRGSVVKVRSLCLGRCGSVAMG